MRTDFRSIPFGLAIPQRGAKLPQGPLDMCVCAHTHTHSLLHTIANVFKKSHKCLIFSFPEELAFKKACDKLYVNN